VGVIILAIESQKQDPLKHAGASDTQCAEQSLGAVHDGAVEVGADVVVRGAHSQGEFPTRIVFRLTI
jgi:hypothetical protein